MASLTKLCVAIFAVGAAALPSVPRSDYAVKERHFVPRAWTNVGAASKSELLHLQIGLKQSNEGEVEKHLMEISDPKHARYGKHLSAAEIHEIIAPAQDSVEFVKAWLREHDIEDMEFNAARDWVHVVIPVEKAERLLQTSYSTFRHSDGTEMSRAPEWSLPLHLHEHIDVVQPTTSFFRPKREVRSGGPLLDEFSASMEWWENVGKAAHAVEVDDSNAPVSQVCNETFTTPKCLRTLYGTINYQPQVPDKNSMAICNYLNETNKRSDIKKFLQTFRPRIVSAANDFEIVIINDASNDQGPFTPAQLAAETDIEGNLDAQVSISITHPTRFMAFSTGGSPPFKPSVSEPTNGNEPYLGFLNFVLAKDDLPNVISTSYGDDEETVPFSFASRVCHGFAQLGARGVSVLFSSGDAGVGSDGTCVSNDGTNTRKFLPAFPAACPFVTAVGGTAGFEPEVAVSRFASGAGFSNYFPMPAYQKTVVNAYIKSLDGLHHNLYNQSGRGYPDVAAQGNHDAIVYAGNITTVGGTSASAPTFSSVIALVNDAIIAKGKPPLGFLNPWIYGGAHTALTDILSGSSFGCNTNGFPAKKGWDAVTGFGTPNFDKLVAAAMN